MRRFGALCAAVSVALLGWAVVLAGSRSRTMTDVALASLLAVATLACALGPDSGCRLSMRRGPNIAFGLCVAIATWAATARHSASLHPLGVVAWTGMAALVPAALLYLLREVGAGPSTPAGPSRPALLGAVVVVAAVLAAACDSATTAALLGLIGAAVVVGSGACLLRLDQASPVDQVSLLWVLAGLLAAGLVDVSGWWLRLLTGWPGNLTALALTGAIWLPVSVWSATRATGRAGIARVLDGLVWAAALILVTFGVLFGVVFVAGHSLSGPERSMVPATIVLLGLALLIFTPVQRRLTRRVRQAVVGERPPLEDLLAGSLLGSTRAVPLDETLLTLVEALRSSLGLSAAEIWTGTEGHLARQISDPFRPVQALRVSNPATLALMSARVSGDAHVRVWLPELLEDRADVHLVLGAITHQDRLLGVLILERPAWTQPPADETTVVREVTGHLARVLHTLELDMALESSHAELRRTAEELRASRARIVAASDAARVKIERDLHDGAQQRLLSVSMRLGALRTQAGAPAETELEAMADDLREAMRELRALARGIYPPLLTEAGLGPAILAAAQSAPIPVRTQIALDGRHAPEVESAVYFCCSEALQNVIKHAGPGVTVSLSLSQEEDQIVFVVEDNGIGFNQAQDASGLGLVSMHDRAGAVGGDLTINSSPKGGTQVHGTIPLGGDPDGRTQGRGS